MMERPIGPLVDALRALGARITCLGQEGYPPLRIEGVAPTAHEVTIDASRSSQFLSALLMAAPLCGGLAVRIASTLISRPYVALTTGLMSDFGAQVGPEGGDRYVVGAGPYRSPGEFHVEGDASGATYFLAAAAVAGEVTVTGISRNSRQGDVGFVSLLGRMGARVEWGEHGVTVSRGGPLTGLDVDMNAMPDAAMTLVPLALYAGGPVAVRNVGSWRVKETDRIAALAREMGKTGVRVDAGEDYLIVDGATRNQEVPTFDTYRDHRMAMCMSLCVFDRSLVINDPGCVSKTFPDYFERLQGMLRA